jgi:hypothetical protein
VDFKKHLFFIIVGVVVVAALGLYAMTVPAISVEAEELKKECINKANVIQKLADAANKPDGIKTPKHVKLVQNFNEKLQKGTEALKSKWAEIAVLKIDNNAPKNDIQFEGWLGTRRAAALDKVAKSKLELPQEPDGTTLLDKIMFSKSGVDEKSSDPNRHRDYRLRHVAIIEEVVDALCKTWGTQNVKTWQEGGIIGNSDVQMSALRLEKLVIGDTRTANQKNQAFEDALARSMRGAGKEIKFGELPYTITPVDVEFIAPLPAVNSIIKDLESRERYCAVVSRIDIQRVAPELFPQPATAPRAGPIPMINTFFQEGPVRVLLTLDLFEYDKSKEADAEKPVAAK